MKLILSDKSRTLDVAKRALYLAWQACGGPAGMGAFRDRPSASEDEVWNNAASRGDYPGGRWATDPDPNAGGVSADYVFGRMMKLNFEFNAAAGTVTVQDGSLRRDYQGWCGRYPTYATLIEAAAEAVGVRAEPETATVS
jgi:hypothetical protein